MQKNKKILFVGMQNNVHLARRIDLIADQGWDLYLFPICFAPIHPLMRSVTIYHPFKIISIKKLWRRWFGKSPVAKYTSKHVFPLPIIEQLNIFLNVLKTKPLGESDIRAALAFGPHVLARVIRQLKPDVICSMEFQHASYNVLRAKELLKSDFPKWMAINCGSDIYYYQHFPDHYQQINRLLKNIDYYACGCERDLEIAKKIGMTAKANPVFPNTGGFNLDNIALLRTTEKTSERKLIMVKGYQHFVGRALTALEAILQCADVLKEYHIVVFLASPQVRQQVQYIKEQYALNISVLEHTDHDKMLQFFAKARIYLGVSLSDGTPQAMIEAMALGAFPIQTNTACCDEWFEDGISGFSIPFDDVAYISRKIRDALMSDELVNKASDINWDVICRRADRKQIKALEIKTYQEILGIVA